MTNPTAERLPPHSPEAEKGVLGCILLSPNESIIECVSALRIGKEAFYDLRHQVIYENIVAMSEQRQPIDIITLQQWMKDNGELEMVGGILYLSALPETVPSSSNLGYYLEIVLEKFTLRKLIATCTGVIRRVYEYEGEFNEFLNGVEREILSIRQSIESGNRGIADITKIQEQLQQEYEDAAGGKTPMGLLTGFPDLDRISGGMMPQEMIVLAGLRSTGKTSLALNIATNVARQEVTVGVISLETSAKKIVHRKLCTLGQMNGGKLQRGDVTDELIRKATIAQSEMKKIRSRILISDDGNQTTQGVSTTARRMYQRGARLIIIDMLQLINGKGKDENEKTADASKQIKGLAKELDIPIIILSSMNRESAKEIRRPRLSDLRNSGQIESDADKVYLLYSESENNNPIRDVKMDIAKNKDGELGTVTFTFFAPQFRMGSQTKIETETDNHRASND